MGTNRKPLGFRFWAALGAMGTNRKPLGIPFLGGLGRERAFLDCLLSTNLPPKWFAPHKKLTSFASSVVTYRNLNIR